jgi:hypothetical protein
LFLRRLVGFPVDLRRWCGSVEDVVVGEIVTMRLLSISDLYNNSIYQAHRPCPLSSIEDCLDPMID